jgi:hypothetical protein
MPWLPKAAETLGRLACLESFRYAGRLKAGDGR